MHETASTPRLADHPSPAAPVRTEERGIALVLVLILSILLYVLVAELVTVARGERFTGENDALLARMRSHMRYTLYQVEEMLLDDLAASAEGEGGPGGGAGGLPMPGAGGGGLPGAGGAGGAGGGEPPPAVDSSQDAWFKPQAFADNDLTTYVWVEDENRKFNLLTLLSPDEDFARESRDRFLRLLDVLREGTQYDLTVSDAERIYQNLMDWMRSTGRTERLPKPVLKSDDAQNPQVTVPLHVGELLMVRGIDEDLLYDRVLDGVLIPGLDSVVTFYTSQKFDPGDPDKQRTRNRTPGAGSGGGAGAPGSGSGPGSSTPGGGSGTEGPAAPAGARTKEQPIGEGVRININTAPRAVLRCLFPPSEVPDAVIEAILRFRNEEAPEEEQAGMPGTGEPSSGSGSGGSPLTGSGSGYYGEFDLGEEKPKKIFKSVDELDKIPEFLSLADPALKEKFYLLTTTKSDVFTVHMASVFKRNEERRVFVIRRARSVLVRQDNGSDGYLHPLTLLEEARGIRVQPEDFPEGVMYQGSGWMDDLDAYAREERSWNPFFRDFYVPPERR